LSDSPSRESIPPRAPSFPKKPNAREKFFPGDGRFGDRPRKPRENKEKRRRETDPRRIRFRKRTNKIHGKNRRPAGIELPFGYFANPRGIRGTTRRDVGPAARVPSGL
jgi:hypothetical protein